MRYRKLGRTEIEISTVALGCWQLSTHDNLTWGAVSESQAMELVHLAMDAGITLFDTAAGYGAGESETLLGKALKGRRGRAVIATKVASFDLNPDALIASCEASLKRLQTDCIDLFQIHWPNSQTPIERTLEGAATLLEQGKIRAFGVSNFGPVDLGNLLAHGRCEVNQLCYNLLFRSIEFGEQPMCVENDIGILCYSPMSQGLLSGKFKTADDVPVGRTRTRHFSGRRPNARHGEAGHEALTFETLGRVDAICRRIHQPMSIVALAWCIHQPGVAAVLAGARTPEQVKLNAAAGDLVLSDDILAELAAATEPLKRAMGHNSDLWEPAGMRMR